MASYNVTAEQKRFFEKHGYLIVRDMMTPAEGTAVHKWAQEVHDLPRTSETPWMPYEEVNAAGKRVLCRTENYANYHDGFNGLLRGNRLLGLLGQLAGEDMLLFKEKNIDSTAYTHVKNIKHLTILIAVDVTNMSNGGLEVVEASHKMEVPIDRSDNCIEKSWVAAQKWTPVELQPGQLLVFGSYLAHRSGANNSNSDRKAIYATYNCKREGDLHDEYYEDRAKLWPPTHKRVEGLDYAEGSMRYGFGSPMLSVALGKQLQV